MCRGLEAWLGGFCRPAGWFSGPLSGRLDETAGKRAREIALSHLVLDRGSGVCVSECVRESESVCVTCQVHGLGVD